MIPAGVETQTQSPTIADQLEWLAPGSTWSELLRWPPDTFALTSAVLGDSGLYRIVVCPPSGRRWPPVDDGDESWQGAIARGAAAWAETASEPELGEPPVLVAAYGGRVAAAAHTPLAALDESRDWELLVALLSLHALADEACEGVGLRIETPLQRTAARRLAHTGTLARLDRGRVRVLPKLRPPEAGITLRSLSHHLAINRSEVETRWYVAPRRRPRDGGAASPRLSVLLVPFPREIAASDFRIVTGPLLNMNRSRYDFFEYHPHERLDSDELLDLVASAKRHVGQVDALILPEAALDEAAITPLQEQLAAAGVAYLVAGARQRATPAAPFGGNYAHLGGGDWHAPPQHKHHRWLLDAAQVHQYHLGAALAPTHSWWEAISLQRRSLTFASISDWLTICPLVCEDLARPDPVSDVIRAIAPTLVVALLLDGPQLASRWPARYASVFADDPGCSVLTLTALGMTERCQPPGCMPSRVIALWKDPNRGLQEIQLADGARAVALTAHARTRSLVSADGREGNPIAELVLSGLEQIR